MGFPAHCFFGSRLLMFISRFKEKLSNMLNIIAIAHNGQNYGVCVVITVSVKELLKYCYTENDKLYFYVNKHRFKQNIQALFCFLTWSIVLEKKYFVYLPDLGTGKLHWMLDWHSQFPQSFLRGHILGLIFIESLLKSTKFLDLL